MVSRTAYFTLFLTALASLVAAVPRPMIRDVQDPTAGRKRGCGVHIDDSRVASQERKFQANRLPPEEGDGKATIDIYFHVIYANETYEGGYVPDEQITAQVARLNEDYKQANIQWNLKGTNRVHNEDWFYGVEPEGESEVSMKEENREGEGSTLNVYLTSLSSENAAGILGYATFPMDYKENPKADGIVLLYETLPGSPSEKFGLGRTLVHEAGHWCGLYHTFQGGCKGAGDEVDDTPPEQDAAYGCLKGRDTCPGAGPDPIHNFMDYSDDSCLTTFTPGQAKRMKSQLRTYRGVQYS